MSKLCTKCTKAEYIRPYLIKARQHMGLSQKEVAERIGCDTKTYRNWENGRSTPSPTNVERLVCVLCIKKSKIDTVLGLFCVSG